MCYIKRWRKKLYLRRRFIDIQIIICEFVFSNSNLGLSLQNEITFIGFIGGRTCICYCSFLVRLSKPWIPRISSKAFQIFPCILDCTFSDIYLEVARLSPGGCISGPCLLDPCHRIWIFVFCWIQVLVLCWFRIFFPVGFGSLFFVGSSSSSFFKSGSLFLLDPVPCFSLKLPFVGSRSSSFVEYVSLFFVGTGSLPFVGFRSTVFCSGTFSFVGLRSLSFVGSGTFSLLDPDPFVGSNSRHCIPIFVFWWIRNFFFWLIGIELDF